MAKLKTVEQLYKALPDYFISVQRFKTKEGYLFRVKVKTDTEEMKDEDVDLISLIDRTVRNLT